MLFSDGAQKGYNSCKTHLLTWWPCLFSYPYYLCLRHPMSSRSTSAASICKSERKWRYMLSAKQTRLRVAATDVLQSPLVVLNFFLCIVIKRTFSGNKEYVLSIKLCRYIWFHYLIPFLCFNYVIDPA